MHKITQNSSLTYKITFAGVTAALYAVVTVLLAPIAFGAVQCRLSEALTVLPVFTGASIWGLGVGCALSNLFGVMSGTSIIGVWDILFGTLASVVAAILSRLTRKLTFRGFPVVSTLFPVFLNGLVIGAELTFAEVGSLEPSLFAFNFLTVSAGQAVACIGGGLLLFAALRKTGMFED